MSETTKKTAKDSQDRAARLKAALKSNMAKRKAQVRARSVTAPLEDSAPEQKDRP